MFCNTIAVRCKDRALVQRHVQIPVVEPYYLASRSGIHSCHSYSLEYSAPYSFGVFIRDKIVS